MADPDGKSSDLYAVLGLQKDCTAAELKKAYKKLAMKWHPDRCSASGNSKYVEEAKLKFQDIQEAYSVLSDTNKRFLYDAGVRDCDDDDGMCDFLNEMADMMSQNRASGNGGESFEELQKLFGEMFHRDMEAFCSTSQPVISKPNPTIASRVSCGESSNASNKRNSSEMNLGKATTEGFSSLDPHLGGFCSGASGNLQGKSKRRKDSRRGR